MRFSFIREAVLTQPLDVVDENLARYQPLNYNRFMWWRSHTDGIKPLSKRAILKDRIKLMVILMSHHILCKLN
jgi:hypothetical protein